MNKYKKALENAVDSGIIIKDYNVLAELVDLVEDEKTLEIFRELKRQKHNCTENKIVGYGFYTQRTGAKSTITEVIIETKVV